MSIEVNGVTLPDIPSEVLAQYPYASIWSFDYEGATIYEAVVTNLPQLFLTSDSYLTTAHNATSEVICYDYFFEPGGDAWSLESQTQNNGFSIEMIGSAVWSNHNIYVGSKVSNTKVTATGTLYFARNDSDPNYYAPKSWFDGMARQVMRLTGTSDKLNTDKMLELAKGVEVGGSGGGDIDALIDKSITEITSNVGGIGVNAFYSCSALTSADFPAATSIGSYAFYSCSALTSADFPAATSIGGNTFASCSALTSADFPAATSIGISTFASCSALTSADFPAATSIGGSAFNSCSALTSADFPAATSIGSSAFYSCSSLTTLILRSEAVCALSNTNAFRNCHHILGTVNSTYNPNGDKDGYFYVPAALVDTYKAATNWSTYASQFRALEDYTVDGTTTGELDPDKI